MDITQLKTLIHVAELGSLSKASDRLHVVQPALSRQIRLLEKELGVPLFDRHGRGMVVTQAGRDVLEHASRIMSELDAIREAVSHGKSVYKGLVKIGMTPTVAEIMTVPLVASTKTDQPALSLRIMSAFTGHLLDWLQRDELEIAVSYNPQPLKSLRTEPVLMENLMYVTFDDGAAHDDTAPVRFADLAGIDLVLPSPRHGLRTIVDDCARKAGITLTISVEADAFGAMIDLVKSGFGATILPLAPIFTQVKNGSLRAVPLIDPVPSRKVVLTYPADRSVSAAARFVGDRFKQVAGELVAKGVWAGHMI